MSQLEMATAVNSGTTDQSSGSWISHDRAEDVLYYTHFAYPIVLLFLFIVVFAAHGIMTASTDVVPPVHSLVTGPGGKPLPNTPLPRERRTKRPGFSYAKRLVFVWLSVGLIFTFIGNALNIVVHALTERNDGWWCGEATTVSDTHTSNLWHI
jgi:ATP-binding cassette, subfamily B, vacuolar membrane transporter HMT1/ACLQ